jgi:transcriptional regulator with XRE-family HTH domain
MATKAARRAGPKAKASDDLCARFGSRLKHLRQAQGWTQADLSAYTNLERAHLSRLETGKVEPCLRVIDSIAKALGVTNSRLLDGV